MTCFEQNAQVNNVEAGKASPLSEQFAELSRPKAGPEHQLEERFSKRGYPQSLAADYQSAENLGNAVSVDVLLDADAAKKSFTGSANELLGRTDKDCAKAIEDLTQQRDSDPAITALKPQLDSYKTEVSAAFAGVHTISDLSQVDLMSLKFESDPAKRKDLIDDIRSRDKAVGNLVSQDKLGEALKLVDADKGIADKMHAYMAADNPQQKQQLLQMIGAERPEIAEHLSKASQISDGLEKDPAFNRLQTLNQSMYKAADMRVLVRRSLANGYEKLDMDAAVLQLKDHADSIQHANFTDYPSGRPRNVSEKDLLVQDGFAPQMAEDLQFAMNTRNQFLVSSAIDTAKATIDFNTAIDTTISKTDTDAANLTSLLESERETDPAIADMKQKYARLMAEDRAAFEALPQMDPKTANLAFDAQGERDPQKQAEIVKQIRERNPQVADKIEAGDFKGAVELTWKPYIEMIDDLSALRSTTDPEKRQRLEALIGPDHQDVINHARKANDLRIELEKDPCYKEAFDRWSRIDDALVKVAEGQQLVRSVFSNELYNQRQIDKYQKLKTDSDDIMHTALAKFEKQKDPSQWTDK